MDNSNLSDILIMIRIIICPIHFFDFEINIILTLKLYTFNRKLCIVIL